jgi:hypothetical protein
MVAITLRSGGSALTHTQLDNNFSNLNQFENSGTNNYLFYAGTWSGSGQGNVFIANGSNSITSGGSNTALGHLAGDGINTGNYNTCMGQYAGTNLTSSQFNTCIGYYAGVGLASTSGENTFIGARAGTGDNTSYRTFVGFETGYTNFDSYATAVGYQASKDMEGLHHTSVGAFALQGNTAYNNANYNTAVGYQAARYAYGYDYLSALGQYAGLEGGHYGVYCGSYTGYDSSNTSYNTFVGWSAGRVCQSSGNTVVGFQAGWYVSGANNVFIGYNAGNSGSSSTYYSGTYNICLGRNALPSSTTASSECTIGGPTTLAGTVISTFRIPGTATTITPSLLAHGGDIAAYYSSDIRLKENIHVIPDALSKVNSLRGVTYDWTAEALEMRKSPDLKWTQRKEDVGVIAQEVEKVLPELVLDRADGYKGIKYERLTALLIEAVKELSARVEELENGIS